MSTERDWTTWLGLAVVGIAAAVMSFTALSDLAQLCGVAARIQLGPAGTAGDIPVSWLLPITVDVLAAVATRVWLRRQTNAEALAYARRSAWSAIAATVVGNAAHGLLVQTRSEAPWWAAVLVGAVPAVAVGAIVHLAVLVGRGPDTDADQPAPRDAGIDWLSLPDDVLAEPWARFAAAWSASVDAGRRQVPTRDQEDGVLVGDLRSEVVERGRPLTRDEVIERYGVGATRATRLREMAARPTVVEDGAA